MRFGVFGMPQDRIAERKVPVDDVFARITHSGEEILSASTTMGMRACVAHQVSIDSFCVRLIRVNRWLEMSFQVCSLLRIGVKNGRNEYPCRNTVTLQAMLIMLVLYSTLKFAY